jgi:molybdopterin-guanine dinucleotide biosynthesis protein A
MVTVSIQAGGLSTRIPDDKALIPLAGKPLIEHVLQRVEGLGDELLITTNRPEAYAHLDARLVSDSLPGTGPLGGLQTALQAASGEAVLVVACDMPFVERGLLEHMLDMISDEDVVIPRKNGLIEPLQAVYARRCLPAVEKALKKGEQRVASFFPEVRVLNVEGEILERLDPDKLSFFNINTPEDLERAEALLRAR